MKNNSKIYEEEGENSYWLSISDLMASILIIFILLFIFRTIDLMKTEKIKEDIIREITYTKENIIDKLQEQFSSGPTQMEIDNITGTVKIDEKILFELNQYRLKPEGKEFLKKMIPVYLNIFMENENFKKSLEQIVIEGHSDDMGSYLYNMDLSQKRAGEVLKYIYSSMQESKYKDELKTYIVASGKSNVNLIYKENGEIDRDRSRRVEIKFKLKEEEALNKIKKTLE